MNVLSAYKRVYHMYNSAGGIQKKGIRTPGSRVTGGCEPIRICAGNGTASQNTQNSFQPPS